MNKCNEILLNFSGPAESLSCKKTPHNLTVLSPSSSRRYYRSGSAAVAYACLVAMLVIAAAVAGTSGG